MRFSRLKIHIGFFFLSIMAIPVVGQKSKNAFEIHELSSNKVVFSINPINIKLSPLAVNGRNYNKITALNYGMTSKAGQPMLPETAALLLVPNGAYTKVTVLESQFEEIPGIFAGPVPVTDQQTQSENRVFQYEEDSSIYQQDSYWPGNLAILTDIKTFRGQKVARIQVNPVQYNPIQRTLRVYKRLKIQVTFDETPKPGLKTYRRRAPLQEKHFDTSLFLNYRALESLPPDLSLSSKSLVQSWYNPQFSYYKLYLDKEGIYSLDYNDLANAGIPVESLDLTRLKIFNQGEDIPIWIAGPVGPTFASGNILYFYADRLKGEDTFYDLYTDTNVFWLTDDGGPGERYQVAAKNLTGSGRSAYHWQTLHLEQDNIFHRSNGSSPIDDDEGWIWRYFFDNDQETIDFEINGAFQEVGVCSLKLRLYGTTRDPINPDHHVRVSINGERIAETFFDEQNELIWEVTFPTNLLNEGNNQITLHLVPDTGAQINQIYLDWLEIVYPRVHAAIQNTLSFREPGPLGPPRRTGVRPAPAGLKALATESESP
ncbi:MAG: C25 family peptidase propeptide domain-containing protein [bacterium]